MKLVPAFIRPVRRARVPRARATRIFVTRRRAALLSLFLVGVSVPVVGFLTTPGGHDVSAAIAEVFRDPLAVMQGRSPGLRGEGAMFQTKPVKERLAAADRAPVGPEGPVERVLPVVRDRPADVVAPPVALAEPMGIPGVAAPLGMAGPDGGPLLVPTTVPPGPDGPNIPGGSSGGGSSGGNPPPAVPEPGTWMMMILGFGLVGSAIRRQSAARRALTGA